MQQITRILRAAHCRSTHHFFAIDALSRIDTAQGQRLGNILLKYHDDYLLGAKAPDTSFRDFQNHVLHVADGNWGGAPQACEKWLVQAIEELNKRRWRKAAYACGVLSHYFTDPLMPLHTAQTPQESVIHRPMEWSVCKSYDEIYSRLTQEQLSVNFQLAKGDKWISKAVTAGASVAHQHYHRLIELYDLEQGVRNPASGLNDESREILSELFCIAITGWARVLSRIADVTETELPEVSLSMTSLLATIDMPLAWIVRKISDRSERRAVQAIFEEYQRTGSVTQNLPPEVKTVERLRSLDVEHTEAAATLANVPKPAASLESTTSEATADTTVSSSKLAARQLSRLDLPEQAPSIEAITATPEDESTGATENEANAASGLIVAEQESAEQKSVADSSDVDSAVVLAFERRNTVPERPRVSVASNLVDAPSIGPKTAKRFKRIGIHTIDQFLTADVDAMVHALGTQWINASLLTDWQAQARLVCELASLCGYKAQLLVALDCFQAAQLAEYSADALHKKIEALTATSEGQRILRSSPLPKLQDVEEWIAEARERNQFVRRAA